MLYISFPNDVQIFNKRNRWFPSSTISIVTKLVHIEYHSVCPLVGIGTLPLPLPQASVPLPPGTKGGKAHSPRGEGLGESQFRRLEKKPNTLPTLWFCVFLTEKTTFKSVVACSQVDGDKDPAEEHEDEYGVHLIGGNGDARGSTRASQAWTEWEKL